MSVLVVGSVALDSVETPTAKRVDILGGSASFFSVAASHLVPVRLVAVVGDDFPEEHVEVLYGHGVDLSGLQRASGRTFRWSGRYLPDMVGRVTLDTQLNVFEHFKPQLPEIYRNTNYVFLANIAPTLQLQVLSQIERPQLVACDTMNFWITGQLNELKEVLKLTDIVLLNDEEVRLLSGQHNLVKAAEAVRQLGPKRVIVKRGDAGAMLFDEAGVFWAPAFHDCQVVDPTGAGDSFAGGFVSYLAHVNEINPRRLRQAMIYGSAIASFSVEDFSLDRLKKVTTKEVLNRCQAFNELVKFDHIEIVNA